MKAVILECRDGYCAVLKDDGTIENIRMHGIVGQEIDMPAVPVRARVRKFPVRRVAAAAVALVAMATGALSQIQEYSYVSVDVDASVEYSLNRMDRVIKVKPLNKKGEELAETMKKAGVTGSKFDKAVQKTAVVLQEDGYVDSENNGVILAVSSRSDKKSDDLAKRAADVLVADDVKTAVETISMKDRKEAKDSGISAGRYAVTRDITGEDSLDEAMIDISRNKSASELIQIAEEMDVAEAEETLEPNEAVVEEPDPELADVPAEAVEAVDEPLDAPLGSTDEVVTEETVTTEEPAASATEEKTEEPNIPAAGVTPADANNGKELESGAAGEETGNADADFGEDASKAAQASEDKSTNKITTDIEEPVEIVEEPIE